MEVMDQDQFSANWWTKLKVIYSRYRYLSEYNILLSEMKGPLVPQAQVLEQTTAFVVRITILILNSTSILIPLAEKECCDGSDEPSGFCPNLCKEIGDTYWQQRTKAREQKIQKPVFIFIILLV